MTLRESSAPRGSRASRGLCGFAPRAHAVMFVAAIAAVPAAAGETTPFRTRNLSPLVSIFGVPVWEPFEPSTQLGVSLELANHYRLSRRGDETLILDGETWRGTFRLRRGVGDGWTFGIELPYYRQAGGVLDGLIDAWHSAFNLPEGGRHRREDDQIAFVLADGTSPFFVLDRSKSGFGDLMLSVGRALGANASTYVQATLKVPVGDEALLAGSGSADLALTLLHSRNTAFRDRPAGFYWGFGALALGDPELIDFDARSWGVLGLLGAGVRPWRRTGLKAQVEVHSALYDSPLSEIGDTGVQLTVGGWTALGEHGVVEIAVSEDLAVSTSPDFGIHVGWIWKISR